MYEKQSLSYTFEKLLLSTQRQIMSQIKHMLNGEYWPPAMLRLRSQLQSAERSLSPRHCEFCVIPTKADTNLSLPNEEKGLESKDNVVSATLHSPREAGNENSASETSSSFY